MQVRAIQNRTKSSKDRGATMIEYALLIAFLALLTAVVVKAMGAGSKDSFNATASQLNSQGGSAPNGAPLGAQQQQGAPQEQQQQQQAQ